MENLKNLIMQIEWKVWDAENQFMQSYNRPKVEYRNIIEYVFSR